MSEGAPKSCSPPPESQVHSMEVSSRADWSRLETLDWCEYRIEAAGEIDYSYSPRRRGKGEHLAGPEGDPENRKRVDVDGFACKYGQLVIHMPNGAILYRPGMTVRLRSGDSLTFSVADVDLADNYGSFTVRLLRVRD